MQLYAAICSYMRLRMEHSYGEDIHPLPLALVVPDLLDSILAREVCCKTDYILYSHAL